MSTNRHTAAVSVVSALILLAILGGSYASPDAIAAQPKIVKPGSIGAAGPMQRGGGTAVAPGTPNTQNVIHLPTNTATTQSGFHTTDFGVLEDFEGAWPESNWQVGGDATYGGQYMWGKRKCNPRTGSYSIFTAGGGTLGKSRGCTSQYPNNLKHWTTFALNFSDVTSATLVFHLWGVSEINSFPYDFLFVGTSTDGNNFNGTKYWSDWTTGSDLNGYTELRLPLNSLLRRSIGWIGFEFVSDDNTPDIGFTIDDLWLEYQLVPNTQTTVFVPMVRNSPPPPAIVPCPDREPNAQPSNAQIITAFGQTCSGQINAQGEDDFYAIDLAANQRVSVALTNMPAGTNFDLYLYEQAFANNYTLPPVAQSKNTGNTDELIVDYVSPKTQRYYIRIYARTGAGGYHLLVTVT